MKAKAVSALREERGLRPDVSREAEPQVVGLAPQTTNERRANTMKTCVLRDPKAVERQKALLLAAAARAGQTVFSKWFFTVQSGQIPRRRYAASYSIKPYIRDVMRR